MEYIEKTLGLPVIRKPWPNTKKMPYFLTERYEIEQVTIDAVVALFLHPRGELGTIGTLQKHIARLRQESPMPVVLVLETINRYRREALIGAKIPFVVPGRQLYLPFLGAVLQERYDAENPGLQQLQPSAQVLFFYYLYQKERELYPSKAVADLDYSAMTISRAARQLVQTGFFSERKDGVQKILSSDLPRKALFDEMKPLLIKPVRSKGYLALDKLTNDFLIAGESALSRLTMLNRPVVPCYAIEGKKQLVLRPYLIDEKGEAAVELWKYDPKRLSKEGVVDPLSLVMSLEGEDERMEMEAEVLLNQVLEG